MSELWLKHVRQEGLVIAATALTDVPLEQSGQDTEEFEECNGDFWKIADKVLGWPADLIVSASADPDLCTKRLTELGVTLRADAAILDVDKENTQLLIRTIGNDDPDRRGAIDGWEGISHQQAFDRLLRETDVKQGVLVSDHVIRLTYSPPGETPGYLEWPIEGVGTTAGRPMLGGLKLVLGKGALWGAEDSRLSGILKRSREHQNNVSHKLAEQVLGALYTLMRGFTVGAEARNAMGELADQKPQHVYEGLLTVLLRLVFVLFAEDRDLIPSSEEDEARNIYDRGYSVRDLFGQLEEDAAQYPDTMEDRYGAWGRLLGLFRLIHNGSGRSFMHARRGKLFDPAAFPFLEGRFDADDEPSVLPISDGCIHTVLRQLLILDGERLSYKTLDVEQIGSVYETIMGFVVTRTKGEAIALKVRPSAGSPMIPAFVGLGELLATPASKRKKFLKDAIGFETSTAQDRDLKAATANAEILAALDRAIDERGSPGKRAVGPGTIILQPTDERRQTGSHYTPRSLTQPIVRDALLPILERLGAEATPDEVLAIKLCDPAMGSGAFLVEACRALGERLEQAWKHHPALLPDDARDDPHVFARREVAKRCLYGVDKNPMATDLAKLSLWLITLARDEDFSFLDHALKTGDSLVGLSLDQIKSLTWEDTDKVETARKRFMFAGAFDKAIDQALETRRAIRSAPDNITFEIQASRLATADKALEGARLAGDAVIGVFFSEKKDKARKEALGELHNSLTLGSEAGWARAREYAQSLRHGEHAFRPFHWQIEFPEVFAGATPGFHAIIGNPPFLGGKKISTILKNEYSDWLAVCHAGSSKNADLVAHFFRRASVLLRNTGTFGLIATKTIAQGDTRESGLRALLETGQIYRAIRRLKWPGAAQVVVSAIHYLKDPSVRPVPLIDGVPVERISALLKEGDVDESPVRLEENKDIAFVGNYILGTGFTFDDKRAENDECEPIAVAKELIAQDPKNQSRIKPFLGGQEVNNDPTHAHRRYVIDFEDFPLRRRSGLPAGKSTAPKERSNLRQKVEVPEDYEGPVAEDWPELLKIVAERVKPERMKKGRSALKERWWLFAERQPALQTKIDQLDRVIITSASAVTYHMFALCDSKRIYSHKTIVIAQDNYGVFGVLMSRIHELWRTELGSTFGSSDALTYNASQVFDTFPLPVEVRSDFNLSQSAKAYDVARSNIMIETDRGLTPTYNRFHDPLENDDDIETLRRLHAEMDDAVLRAYGWGDLADLCASGAEFEPRFLTEEDEPEFAYQKRLFWPAPFRDKVLARLLELNKKRARAEALARKAGRKKASQKSDQQGELL